jgi:hypothetical protein
MCDSFLGEGGGRGLVPLQIHFTRINPSLPLRTSNSTPPVGREWKLNGYYNH